MALKLLIENDFRVSKTILRHSRKDEKENRHQENEMGDSEIYCILCFNLLRECSAQNVKILGSLVTCFETYLLPYFILIVR